jgi:uncharacterized protein
MKCPTDSATLVMSERNGVEIDYCPECRGVWLDRGELDKIVDRAEAEFTAGARVIPPAPAAAQYPDRRYGADRYDDRERDRGYGFRDGYRGKKRESWLSELFD